MDTPTPASPALHSIMWRSLHTRILCLHVRLHIRLVLPILCRNVVVDINNRAPGSASLHTPQNQHNPKREFQYSSNSNHRDASVELAIIA